jgi:S1-C subfamily serine protease
LVNTDPTADNRTQRTVPKLADFIDGIRPTVVQVAIHAKGGFGNIPPKFQSCFKGGTYCIAGTGFFVSSNGDIVTAFHVVDGYRTKDGSDDPGAKQVIDALGAIGIPAEMVIGVAIPNIDNGRITVASTTNYFQAILISTDPSHDLALIRATVNPFTHMPRTFGGPGASGMPQAMAGAVSLSMIRPRDGEEVFAAGYPFGETGLITTSGVVASAWKTKVLLRAEAAGFTFPAEVYNLDLRINPGNSGGPVFRMSDSALIGVSVEYTGSLGIAVPAKFVSSFLTNQKVPWTATADSPQPPH